MKIEKNPMNQSQQGFTLVEMLIVTALTVLLIVAGTSLFISTILGGGRANTSTIVKTNGDYALGQMEFLLRNGTKLLPLVPSDPSSACYQNMDSIRVQSADREITTFFTENNKIASNSGVYLTSDEVTVVNRLDFDCLQSPDRSVSTVQINFTLSKGQEGVDRVSDIQEQTFSTTVTLRGL